MGKNALYLFPRTQNLQMSIKLPTPGPRFCATPLPCFLTSRCWIQSCDFFPLKADLAAGRSDRSAVELSWEHHNPHSRKRAHTALFFSLFLGWGWLSEIHCRLLTRRNRHSRCGELWTPPVFEGSWGSLPSQGRPPRLFPAPRTVKTWSSHRICGKVRRFSPSLSLFLSPQCQSCLSRGDYRVITMLCRMKPPPPRCCIQGPQHLILFVFASRVNHRGGPVRHFHLASTDFS